MLIQISIPVQGLCFKSVGDLKEKLCLSNFIAAVNGESQSDDYIIKANDCVTLALPIKLQNQSAIKQTE